MPLTRRASLPHPSLAALQSWFFERVTSRPPSRAESSSPPDDSRLVHGGVASAEQRLAIYHRAYFARLIECLRDDYPAVAFTLGPATFDALCTDFIEAHPSESASLSFYGAPFAPFCATPRAGLAGFVSELARLEWAVVEAIHAEAEPALDATALADVPADAWERARMIPSPALRIVRATHPVQRYYQAFLEGEATTVPDPGPSTVAVCRRGADIWRVALEATHARLLERLVAGQPLATALDTLTADSSDHAAAAALQHAFSDWLSCGFFAGISVDHHPRQTT